MHRQRVSGTASSRRSSVSLKRRPQIRQPRLFLLERRGRDGGKGRILAEVLRVADHKVAAGRQGVVEAPHQCVLGGLVEIDHHVPAEDYIEFQAELNGVHQIEGLENHIVPDNGGHHVLLPAGHRLEVLLFPRRRDGVRQLVDPPLGGGQGLLGDVRGQDAGVPLVRLTAQEFLDIDGDVVGLLAAGAARAPDRSEERRVGKECRL